MLHIAPCFSEPVKCHHVRRLTTWISWSCSLEFESTGFVVLNACRFLRSSMSISTSFSLISYLILPPANRLPSLSRLLTWSRRTAWSGIAVVAFLRVSTNRSLIMEVFRIESVVNLSKIDSWLCNWVCGCSCLFIQISLIATQKAGCRSKQRLSLRMLLTRFYIGSFNSLRCSRVTSFA